MAVTENVKRTAPHSEHAAIRERWGAVGEKYPLLVERDQEWGFGPPTGAAWGERILCWRLPKADTSKLIHMPDSAKDSESPNAIGILVSAGTDALDRLETRGIFPGHYVIWERFAGWETEDFTVYGRGESRFIRLNAIQVTDSVDLQSDLISGRVTYLRGEDGRTRVIQNALPEAKAAKRRAKLTAVANHPSASPQERETAARILKRKK